MAGLEEGGLKPPFTIIVSWMVLYEFKNPELLRIALTHKSVDYKNNYEKLEFLGDSLLNFFITRFLYEEFSSSYSLTELAQAKRYIASNEFLAKITKKLNLPIRSKARVKDGYISHKVYADVLEAYFCAIFLDSDVETAYGVFKQVFAKEIEEVFKKQAYKQDYKTMLLKLCKERFETAPVYKVVDIQGANVVVECRVKDFKEIAEGFDLKTAEQNASKKLYLRLIQS